MLAAGARRSRAAAGARRAGLIGAVLAALAAGGCGDSASVAVPAATGTSGAAAAGGGPAIPAGYAGLGATGTAFRRAHQESPRGRQRGVPLVSGLTRGPGGRITAYDIQFNDRPPLSDYERLVSAIGVSDLPRDRVTIATAPGCLVYGSPSLKRLIGVSYARVTSGRGTTIARVQSSPTSTC